jgi:hypothetical protein
MEKDEIENSIIRFISEIRELSKLGDEQIRQILIKISSEKPEIFETIKQFNLLQLEKEIFSSKVEKLKDVSGTETCNLGYFNDKGCDY